MSEKIFRIFLVGNHYRKTDLIGLAKAMIKTKAKVIGIKEFCFSEKDIQSITFSVQENYSIFKPQLESYGFAVKEIK